MTQKYLLNSDEDAETVTSLRMYLSGSYKHNELGYQLRLGALTKLLRNVPIFAYDLPELSEKFPQSFISNNVLFINAEFLNPKKYRNEDLHQAKIVVANSLIDIVQKNLDVEISKDERIATISEHLTIGIEDRSLFSNTSIMKMKDLENLLLEAGLPKENAMLSQKLKQGFDFKEYLMREPDFEKFIENKKSNKPNM